MKNKIALSLGATIVGLIATGIAMVAIAFLHSSAMEDQRSNARNLAHSIVGTVEAQLTSVDYVLQVATDEIKQEQEAGHASFENITAFLVTQQQRFPNIDWLQATNANGEAIYGRGVDPERPGQFAEDAFYQQLRRVAQNHTKIAQPIVGQIRKQWVWLMARPIGGPANAKHPGLVVASMSIDNLVGELERYRLAPGSEISLRDSNLRLVARTVFDRTATQSIRDDRFVDELSAALAAGTRQGSYESSGSAPDEPDRLFAFERSEKFGFLVQVGFPKSFMATLWLRQTAIVVALLAGFLTILGLITREVSRKVNNELTRQRTVVQDGERTLLKTVIQTLPYMIWLKDPEGVFLACNPKFERYYGHPENEIIGKKDDDFVAKELAAFFREHDLAAIAADKPTINEEWITYPDNGQRALLSTTKTPMRDGDGRVIGVLGIAYDITELRANQEELKRHRNQLECLVTERTAELLAAHRKALDTQFAMDKVGIGITWADVRTGQFLYVNDYHASTLGYTTEEMLCLRVFDIDPNIPEAGFEQLAENIHQQEFIQFETTQRKKNGDLIPVEMVIYYHPGSDQTKARFIAFMTDITRRKEGENALLSAKLAAEKASDVNAALVTQLEAANRRLAMSDQRLKAMFAMSQNAPGLEEMDLLCMGIDEAVRLTRSEIGYLHFVNDDQETIALKTWSTDTLRQCTATYDDHYPVSAAGVWADTVRFSRPVIHNDYQNLEQRKGCPDGHVNLIRHIGIPVIDGGKVRLLMGVGNKADNYDDSDVDQLQLIGNDLWSIIVRRRAESALAEAKKTAEAASVAKSAFLANMSHEIRTPLNAITGMTHLIRRSGISPEQNVRLNKIERAGHHLLEIINAILDLSKIEAGKFVLDEAEVDLGSVVENAASILSHQAQSKNLGIVVDNQLTQRVFLGDATRLQQCLLNYGSNAIKFTEQGDITLRLSIQEEQRDYTLIRFEVEDHGIGIEPENLQRLFSAFEQADNSTTRKYGGTGLGLAITKKLAQLMNGNAGATSQIGQGSTFWFTARLKRCAIQTSIATPVPAMPAETILARNFRSARLLLVEDEPINREITLLLLNSIWPSVDFAEDGHIAVRLASENAYDLILMDVQMPNLDGLDATRQIRHLPNRQTVPIIAMTANAFSEDRQQCFNAGMNDFIAKPMAPETLFEAILKWLRK